MYPDSKLQLSYETKEAIFFFSHAFDPLNNWSAHAVKLWGKTFPTAEHGYHYRKFTETLPAVAEAILHAPSPWAAMQIERKYRAKRAADWREVKVGIMTELIRAKVDQNEDVRTCLLKTGRKTLIESSPWDDFWGIGDKGIGENHIGKIYMQIRNELQEPAT